MITLQPADPAPDGAHSQAVWEWRNDPVTRQMSRTTELIPWPAHRQWYERTAGAAGTALLIALVDGTPACMVRFDTLEPGAAEVHINMNPALRGKGLGKPILTAACAYGFDHLKLSRIFASIKAENAPSLKIFGSVGFTRSGERAGLLSYKLTRD
jgi:RimJ/RimL family protein N-acetyltransferase